MAQNGEINLALTLVEDMNCEVRGVQEVIHFASDLQIQRRAMFAARERWRGQRQSAESHRHFPWHEDFYRLLSLHWQKLEPSKRTSGSKKRL